MKMKDEYVKAADYKGAADEKTILDAVKNMELNAYIDHPITGKPFKVPKELAKRIAEGEGIDIDLILNYKSMN